MDLAKEWKALAHPSAGKFYDLLRSLNPGKSVPTMMQIKDFVDSQALAQTHKPIVKQAMGHFICFMPYEVFQMDLIDMSKFAHFNNGFNWLLVCIDAFTRFAWAQPVKNKTSTSVATAVAAILTRAENQPLKVLTDSGGEFAGAVADLLKKAGIQHETTIARNDHHVLGIADRFCRTIKTNLYKQMAANDSARWVGVLPRVLEIYNNTPHRGLPRKATPTQLMASKVLQSAQGSVNAGYIVDAPAPIAKVGDSVRVALERTPFSRGFGATFSSTIHKVAEANSGSIVTAEGKRYPVGRFQVVDSAPVAENPELVAAVKTSRQRRKLFKEGLEEVARAVVPVAHPEAVARRTRSAVAQSGPVASRTRVKDIK